GFLRLTKLSEDQSRAIPGCFIFIGCWIKSYPYTTDTKDTFFSDWLFLFFLLADNWQLMAELQGIRGDVLDSSMVRAARPGHVCALRHIKYPRVFFQREKYDVWRECVTKDRNE